MTDKEKVAIHCADKVYPLQKDLEQRKHFIKGFLVGSDYGRNASWHDIEKEIPKHGRTILVKRDAETRMAIVGNTVGMKVILNGFSVIQDFKLGDLWAYVDDLLPTEDRI